MTKLVYTVHDGFMREDLATFFEEEDAVSFAREKNKFMMLGFRSRFVVERCHFVGGRVV